MFNQSKIDKLSSKKRKLAMKKEQLTNTMNERNSARETKIKVLENKCFQDREEVNKKIIEIDRQIDKLIREIDSEQIYVNEVANMEKDQYFDEKKDKIHAKGGK